MDSATLTAQEVFAAARHGESWRRAVVAETVYLLALAVASICTLLDPEVIVLWLGGVAHLLDLLIEPICQRLAGVVPVLPRNRGLAVGKRRAAAMVAVMLVLSATSTAVVVSQLC